MLLLRLLKNNFFKGTTTIWILTMMSLVIVNGRPQDPKIFEDLATKGLMMAGNMAEMIGNAGMISKQMGFEMPFANGNSNTAIGTGAAFRNYDDDDSSEEDRRRRKKRSLNFLYNSENDNILKDWTQLHRDKRSPCHTGGTGSGGNGGDGGAGGDGVDGDDLDIAERRRRAYARIMAARKRARNAKKTTRKTTTNTNRRRKQKYLINNDVNNDVEQTLRRRKRQTELEDLNENMTNASKDFQQQAQEIAEKVRNVFEGFINSINEMAQKLKENLSIKNSSNSEDI